MRVQDQTDESNFIRCQDAFDALCARNGEQIADGAQLFLDTSEEGSKRKKVVNHCL